MHCSGGVGRSGAFIASHSKWRQFKELADEGNASLSDLDVSLVPTVTALRLQRHPWAVEGQQQLAFAYSSLARLLDAHADS